MLPLLFCLVVWAMPGSAMEAGEGAETGGVVADAAGKQVSEKEPGSGDANVAEKSVEESRAGGSAAPGTPAPDPPSEGTCGKAKCGSTECEKSKCGTHKHKKGKGHKAECGKHRDREGKSHKAECGKHTDKKGKGHKAECGAPQGPEPKCRAGCPEAPAPTPPPDDRCDNDRCCDRECCRDECCPPECNRVECRGGAPCSDDCDGQSEADELIVLRLPLFYQAERLKRVLQTYRGIDLITDLEAGEKAAEKQQRRMVQSHLRLPKCETPTAGVSVRLTTFREGAESRPYLSAGYAEVIGPYYKLARVLELIDQLDRLDPILDIDVLVYRIGGNGAEAAREYEKLVLQVAQAQRIGESLNVVPTLAGFSGGRGMMAIGGPEGLR
jgi:hypothetical protein